MPGSMSCSGLRVFKIDPDKCKGCSKCARNCPVSAFRKGEITIVIDNENVLSAEAVWTTVLLALSIQSREDGNLWEL